MAPTCPETRSSTLSMKLLVDTKSGRVIYAEAGKDVVDFLFSLLTLPVATVVKVLSKDAMVGCIGNLYGSVERLDAAYVRSADAKATLLSPAGGHESWSLLQLQPPAAAPPPVAAGVDVYQCSEGGDIDECYNYVALVKNTPCRLCGGAMNVPMEVVGSSDAFGSEDEEADADQCQGQAAHAGMGFVQGIVTYTIMDDLTVAPMSTVSGITALRGLGVTDITSLEGEGSSSGGLEMLRASLQSKTVLTDVFLGKNMSKDDAAAPSNKKKLKATSSQKKKPNTAMSKKRK
ncbi:unnamed protein product [Urochloa decumbens]|uniref:DUF674 domain-containing protein n=1 Tax=Urochloa decumbens TaxID=240449 RepID=A0ABC8ZBK2_9POAL